MRVLLSGYYGFGNAGDEALLEGLVSGLTRRGHQPVVLSADPKGTRALHGVDAVHRLRGLLPALVSGQAVVSGGGGLLQDVTSRRSLRYYLAVIRAARAAGKRVVVYGQSIGPLSRNGRSSLAGALRGIPIAVRDKASQELLAGLEMKACLVPDPALLLQPPPLPADQDSDRPVLLVPRSGHRQLGDALLAAGSHFRLSGRSVEVLLLHPNEDEDEGRRLASGIPGATLRWAGDHRQALSLIAAAGLVLSARLHGLVLAAAAGTPFVGLVYDPKVSGFLEQVDGAGLEPPIDHARLVELAEACLPLPPNTLAGLRKRAEAGLDWLDGALRGTA